MTRIISLTDKVKIVRQYSAGGGHFERTTKKKWKGNKSLYIINWLLLPNITVHMLINISFTNARIPKLLLKPYRPNFWDSKTLQDIKIGWKL